ncbi:hypothetical protein EMCG_07051 [[Emmonsia] crescens]|uniref:Uncharacterized protein n=1 Tax=[Emmonsia] crescens TaxID=73230 RepID=A0A0G2JBC6_9EURO|nr:hypothetical protein EMCG_07051 [Emmonsia crescens UAMH 3008]
MLIAAGADVHAGIHLSYGTDLFLAATLVLLVTTEQLPRILPFRAAVICGHARVVQALIDGRANVNGPDFREDMPTPLAIMNAREDVVKVLLDNGADVSAAIRSLHQDTALHLAAETGNVKIVELLLPRLWAVGMSARNRQNRTPLD